MLEGISLVASEECEALSEASSALVRRHGSRASFRAWRDGGSPGAGDPVLWRHLVELGAPAIPFPEELGGFGLGFSELAAVAETLGRTLAATPLCSTAALGGQALLAAGSEAQKTSWIPRICEGTTVLTAGLTESDPVRATQRGGDWSLDGGHRHVLDGHVAEGVVLRAECDEGPALFLVRTDAAGVEVRVQERMDHRPVGSLSYSGAIAERLPGPVSSLELAVDRAVLVVCAEALGGMQAAFDQTLEYVKTRKQFGRAIGSFQVVQHRLVDCFTEIELARATLVAALAMTDSNPGEAGVWVSAAKVRCGDAYAHISREAVQLHGGIGVTDECDIGFYLKRAKVVESTLGSSSFHRRRWAELSGY